MKKAEERRQAAAKQEGDARAELQDAERELAALTAEAADHEQVGGSTSVPSNEAVAALQRVLAAVEAAWSPSPQGPPERLCSALHEAHGVVNRATAAPAAAQGDGLPRDGSQPVQSDLSPGSPITPIGADLGTESQDAVFGDLEIADNDDLHAMAAIARRLKQARTHPY